MDEYLRRQESIAIKKGECDLLEESQEYHQDALKACKRTAKLFVRAAELGEHNSYLDSFIFESVNEISQWLIIHFTDPTSKNPDTIVEYHNEQITKLSLRIKSIEEAIEAEEAALDRLQPPRRGFFESFAEKSLLKLVREVRFYVPREKLGNPDFLDKTYSDLSKQHWAKYEKEGLLIKTINEKLDDLEETLDEKEEDVKENC